MRSISRRKFIGTIILLIFLAIYAVVMFIVGTALAVNTTSRIAAWGFYALAGFGWIVPCMWIIKWMVKPLQSDGSSHRAETSGAPRTRS